MLHGALGQTFRVEYCMTDGPLSEADLGDIPDDYGFSKGSTVLVGIVKTGSQPSDLRYAVPSCWGPLHLRLDGMTDAERNELLGAMRDQLAGKPMD